MSSYSLCPQCKQQVAIPDAAEMDARVRCPLCDAEFALGDVLADRVEGPPTLVLITPPASEAAEAAEPPHEEPHLDPETEAEIARLDAAAGELADEASAIQSQAEGLQVTAHTSEPEPVELANSADALETEAKALMAKVEAMPNPDGSSPGKAAHPAAAATAYRAAGGALVATADALDVAAHLLQARAPAGAPPALPPETPGQAAPETAVQAPAGETDLSDGPLGLADWTLEQEPETSAEDELAFESHMDSLFEEASPAEAAKSQAQGSGPLTPGPSPATGEGEAHASAEAAQEAPVAEAQTPLEELESELSEAIHLEEKPAGGQIPLEDQTVEVAVPETNHDAEGPMPEPTPESLSAGSELSECDQLLRRALLSRSKAEVLRARGEALIAQADSLAVEPKAEDEGSEAGWHSAWSPAAPAAVGMGTAVADREPVKIRPRRERKPKSVVRELIGVVLGGITGLTIAYYILNIIGTQYDFLHIYLPGIKHTVKHRPAWWPGFLKEKAPPEEADETPAPEKPAPAAKGGAAKKTAKVDQPGKAANPAKADKATKPAADKLPDIPPPGLADSLPELPKASDMALPDAPELPPLDNPPGLLLPEDNTPPSKPEESPSKPDATPAKPDEPAVMPAETPAKPDESPTKPEEPAKPAETPAKPDETPAKPAETPAKPEEPAKPAETPAKPEEPAKPAVAPPKAQEVPAVAPTALGKTVDMQNKPSYETTAVALTLTKTRDAAENPMNLETYALFCHLGEIISFVDPKGDVVQWQSQKAIIEKLLQDTGQKNKNANVLIIAKLAHQWLDNQEREYPGILVAGKIREAGKTPNGLSIAKIALAKPDKEAKVERILKVVSTDPLDVQPDDRVMVLGGLVAGGRDENRELVVWHGMVVKFPVAAKP